jgi:PPIC-type PPIASE domain
MRHCGRSLFIFCLLVSSKIAFAQTQGGEAAQKISQPPAATSQIPDDAPVITIEGLCANDLVTGKEMATASTLAKSGPSDPAQTSSVQNPRNDTPCKTVVTRVEFENLLYAMDPKGSDHAKTLLVKHYPDMLLFAQKARELGLDKDPKVQAKMRYDYLDDLDHAIMLRMRDQAFAVPEPVLEKYYQDHPERFVFLGLLRIDVPKQKQHSVTSGSAAVKVDSAAEEKEMARVARTIHKEAIAGGGFVRLEAKAYKLGGYAPDDVSDVDIGDRWTVDTLPKEFARVIYDLKPGQVSPLVETPQAYLIYKLTSKEKIPWKEARDRAATLMDLDAAQVIRDSVKTQLNDAYFTIPASTNEREAGKAEGK